MGENTASSGSSSSSSTDWASYAAIASSVLDSSGTGGGMFSTAGGRKREWRNKVKDSYRYARTYQPEITNLNAAANIQGTVDGANQAGIHPLYALGASGGGSSPAFSMPGQSPTGSHKDVGRALMEYSQMQGQRGRDSQSRKESDSRIKNDELQRQLTQLKIDEIKNDAGRSPAIVNTDPKSPYVLPNINSAVQEIDPGKVDPHYKKNPERNLSVISPVTDIRLGSQILKSPVEETDSFFEDPVLLGMATYFYKGNKNFSWSQMINEWTGRKLTPQEATAGTKAMFRRLGLSIRRAKGKSLHSIMQIPKRKRYYTK